MAAVKISSARRQAAQKFRAPQQYSFSNINRDAGPYGVRLSGCAGIRETADMDATVPLHDNRPAHRRAVRGSGGGDGGTSDSMRNLFVPWLESDKGNPKPLVFGGVLFHISFAVERNMAAGGIEKKVVGPLRPKVTRARGAEYPSPEAWGKRKATGRRGRRPLRGASIWVRRKMRTGCGAKKARSG